VDEEIKKGASFQKKKPTAASHEEPKRKGIHPGAS
jgi:hypothetical protein